MAISLQLGATATPLGTIHIAINLVAVGAVIIALRRDKEITARHTPGKIYIITTVLTCLAGLMLIAWSASFTYIEMERFWRNP